MRDRTRNALTPWASPNVALASLIAAASLAVVSACSNGAIGDRPAQAPDGEFVAARNAMVDAYADISEISDPLVLEAMRAVRREEFVLSRDRGRAYREMALAINAGQTISQPLVVALMTDLLDLQPGERVLEIGTGSGYQAAVLAEITDHVYSIEIIPSLADEVAARLDRLGYDDIELRQADGYFGWEEEAPFDGIIVTAAPDHVPPPLLRQLADGGRMAIPVGPPGAVQTLWLIERRGEEYKRTNQGAVRFVPFIREGR
ncbi:MAG: protein-L-isoaspartate(D-aspartate) O-methyltransferase [Chloroflexi bacterium]|nr:protein-L-isoaspartate(D-aspartate) O-methyltransferase [Chloroflexota bacterium]